MKALVIDPFPMSRDVLCKKIRSQNPYASITETDDVDHLPKIIQRESPDIVLVDIAIFPKHALAHLRAIKRQLPASVIVVLTTHDSVEHKAAANLSGADYFISKTDSSSLPLLEKVLNSLL